MNPISNELYRLLAEQAALFSREEAHLARRLNLSRGELECLRAIHGSPQSSVRYVSKVICMNASQLSRVLDRLEDKGLVVRSLDKKDRRNVDVALSEQGAAIAHEAESWWGEKLDRILQEISAEQVESSMKLLKALTKLNNTTSIGREKMRSQL